MDSNKLKVKVWKKIYTIQTITKIKKLEWLYSYQIQQTLKKIVTRNRKGHFTTKGQSIKNYTRIIYNPNNGLYEENVTELKKRNQKNTQK